MDKKLAELLAPVMFRNDAHGRGKGLNEHFAMIYAGERYEAGMLVYVIATYVKQPISDEPYVLLQPTGEGRADWRCTAPRRLVRVLSPLELLAREGK